MYDKAMQELNIKLWEDELKRCRDKEESTKKRMDDDPMQMLIDCNLAFAKLMDDNQGADDRTNPQFKAELAKLARKEKRAKLLSKDYNISDVMDEYHKAKMHATNVNTELQNLKFSYKMRWERSKDKRREIEAEEVKRIVDEVSK